MSQITLPAAFQERMKSSLQEEYEEFLEALSGQRITSIRRNDLKSKKNYSEKHVPWCGHAFYLADRPSFNHEPEFHTGAYYVQEASSMALYKVLSILEIEKNPLIIDLCASPGGKSTTILDYLKGDGVLIANEVIKPRANTLKDNIIKWGHPNAIVTNSDPSHFSKLTSIADVIVVDAPCSGEGLFRKQQSAADEWSQANVDLCSARQRRILHDILPTLKNDGYLIYCTCTYNDQENIDNVIWASEEYELTSVRISGLGEYKIKEVQKGGQYGYQCFPHHVDGEGFFMSILKKSLNDRGTYQVKLKKAKLESLTKDESELVKEWVRVQEGFILKKSKTNDVYLYPDTMYPWVEAALKELRIVYSGIKVGTLNRRIFLPSHELAMANYLLTADVKQVELNKEQANLFYRKTLSSSPDETKGWQCLTFNQNGLGWIKQLGNRINNYLPNHLVVKGRNA